MTAVALVCLGAAIGAPGRYLVDRAIQARHDSVMPWGTMLVNVGGSLVLGALAGVSVDHAVPAAVASVVGTGLCGALTTYSTFSYETLRLLETGAGLYALLNVGMSLLTGLSAAAAGFALGSTL